MDCIKSAKKILGEDIFDQIKKSDVGAIYKPDSGTAVAMQELQMALQIVPRAILSYLMSNLKHLEKGHNIELKLPFADATLMLTKVGADTFNGKIHAKGKILNEFNYRSIPAIGVIIMTTFELYDIKELPEQGSIQQDNVDKLQKLIDERLYLRNLIGLVLEEKLSQKDAIERFMSQKIGRLVHMLPPAKEEEPEESEEHIEQNESEESSEDGMDEEEVEDIQVDMKQDKKSKLKDFLEKRKNNKKVVEIDKKEITCCDCGSKIEKTENTLKPCICFGNLMDSTVKIKKSQDRKYIVRFPEEFDLENINMFVRILKNNNRG